MSGSTPSLRVAAMSSVRPELNESVPISPGELLTLRQGEVTSYLNVSKKMFLKDAQKFAEVWQRLMKNMYFFTCLMENIKTTEQGEIFKKRLVRIYIPVFEIPGSGNDYVQKNLRMVSQSLLKIPSLYAELVIGGNTNYSDLYDIAKKAYDIMKSIGEQMEEVKDIYTQAEKDLNAIVKGLFQAENFSWEAIKRSDLVTDDFSTCTDEFGGEITGAKAAKLAGIMKKEPGQYFTATVDTYNKIKADIESVAEVHTTDPVVESRSLHIPKSIQDSSESVPASKWFLRVKTDVSIEKYGIKPPRPLTLFVIQQFVQLLRRHIGGLFYTSASINLAETLSGEGRDCEAEMLPKKMFSACEESNALLASPDGPFVLFLAAKECPAVFSAMLHNRNLIHCLLCNDAVLRDVSHVVRKMHKKMDSVSLDISRYFFVQEERWAKVESNRKAVGVIIGHASELDSSDCYDRVEEILQCHVSEKHVREKLMELFVNRVVLKKIADRLAYLDGPFF